MIRIFRSLTTEVARDDAFALVADFSNLTKWDPGIASSSRLDDGPLAVGARFEVKAKFLGREIPMTYEVTLFEPPHRIVLEGIAPNLRAVDDIRFGESGKETRIDYHADFYLLGALKWTERLAKPAFDRLANRAMSGMSGALSNRVDSTWKRTA